MPTAKQHRLAACRHLQAYRSTYQKHPGWGATMLFYAALHMVEAHSAKTNNHCTNHCHREEVIKKRYGTIWSAYLRLRNESEKSRYIDPVAFSMNSTQVDAELRKKKLREIINFTR